MSALSIQLAPPEQRSMSPAHRFMVLDGDVLIAYCAEEADARAVVAARTAEGIRVTLRGPLAKGELP
jgi:hypothetical protein